MIFCKEVEIFAEAIPAGVIQMYAFVSSPSRSIAAAGSIIISALTTGFGAALVSYGESVLMYKVRQRFLLLLNTEFLALLPNIELRLGHLSKKETRDT